jgi:hypothetical protein
VDNHRFVSVADENDSVILRPRASFPGKRKSRHFSGLLDHMFPPPRAVSYDNSARARFTLEHASQEEQNWFCSS